MAEARVDMADVYRQVTLRVTVHQRLTTGLRARLALWLIKLAGAVAPWGMEVDDDIKG